jgi:hypothetical protein
VLGACLLFFGVGSLFERHGARKVLAVGIVAMGIESTPRGSPVMLPHCSSIRRISSSGISGASVRSLASREAFAHRLQREWKSEIKRAELY